MSTTPKLEQTLLGKTRSQLLTALFGAPEEQFFVRQLARRIEASAGTVQRELRTLTEVGLILRTQRDTQVLYQANKENPVFADLKSLLAKTMGVFYVLREALQPVSSRLEFAFVYGSFARKEETATSDIDLLLCGELEMEEALELLIPMEARLMRPINPTIYARDELRMKLRAGNHFLTSLQSAALTFLVGDEHEFREIR